MIGRLVVATHAHTNTQVWGNPLGNSSALTLGKLLCRSECKLYVGAGQFNAEGVHKLLFHPKWRGGPVHSALRVYTDWQPDVPIDAAIVRAAIVLELKENIQNFYTGDYRAKRYPSRVQSLSYRRFVHLLVHIGVRTGRLSN